jgi:subtilisin family serine protease
MVRKNFLLSATAIFLACLFLISYLSFVNSNVLHAVIDKKVYSSLEKEKEARVIVKFRNEGVGSLKKVSLADIKEKGYSNTGKGKIIRAFDYLNGFSAVINTSDLKNLSFDEKIASIELIGTKELFLQDSVPLINGTAAKGLQYNGINLTGKGQTVCIIDTGVNYSHADLGGCYGNNNVSSNCKVIGGWDYCADNNLCFTEDNNPMDVNGHGTHVSGIVAANGTINGAAPEAQLVVIKAYSNVQGVFYDDVLREAIDWCVNNASRYNISVISMSLGSSGLYSSYCDNLDDPADITAAINNAVAKNISVVAATGNNGSVNAISSPACIQNATPVGSIRKDDASIDFNRNSLVQLLAPGVSISSTIISGGYDAWSGTSMATPHVAGAFAIARQYLSLTNRTKTPMEIESIFNSTGKRIFDSLSELNFSRINVYSAVISLDNSPPSVSLNYPLNNSMNSSSNISFSCNASDLQLSNITFYLWNSSGIVNRTAFNISGAFNTLSINISDLTLTNYEWNCLAGDLNGNSAFAERNFSFVIGNLSTILSAPANNSYTSSANINFSCSSLAVFNLTNVTFYLRNSTGGLVYNKNTFVSGITNTTVFNYSFFQEGLYFWNCLSMDNYSQSAFATSNFSFSYDITPPNLTLDSPSGTLSSTNVVFNLTLNEKGLCYYSINLGNNNSMNTTDNLFFTNSSVLNEGEYNVTYSCYDLAGNLKSGNASFIITIPCSGCGCTNSCGGGGGGGGGTISKIMVLDNERLASGVSEVMVAGEKINLEMQSSGVFVNHSISLKRISTRDISILIESNPININLSVGEEKKLSLNSDKYFDLYIKLNSIINSQANLTLKQINEPINTSNSESNPRPGKNIASKEDSIKKVEENLPADDFFIKIDNWLELTIFVLLVFLSCRLILKRRKVRIKKIRRRQRI